MRRTGAGIASTIALLLTLAGPHLAEGATVRPPASVAAPVESLADPYTVSWAPSPSLRVTYQLQEATDSRFTHRRRIVYRGTGTSVDLSGRVNGRRYFYRVRAVRPNALPSRWVRGANAVQVKRPALPPASITVPTTSASGAYQVIWGASPTSSATYELQEATDELFTVGLRPVYSGALLMANITGRPTGATYYYRVRANRTNYSPSAWVAGANGCVVAVVDVTPPGPVTSFAAAPAATQVDLSWVNPGAADLAGVKVLRRTDRLPAAVDDGTIVHNGPGSSVSDPGLGAGTYYYAAFAYDTALNYSTAATATAEIVVPTTCAGCHNGHPGYPLAPNVINGTLPGSDGLSYNWFGTNNVKQDGGHGDPQGRDNGLPVPGCTDCHDLAEPAGGLHRNGTLESVLSGGAGNANTAHLKAEFFTKFPANGPGAWSIQVAFDNYCTLQCHAAMGVWPMRHENTKDTLPTAANHYSVEFGTHGTIADGSALMGGKTYPIDENLNSGAAGLPDFATCVTCHDPHGTTRLESKRSSNRMVRDHFAGPSPLCLSCHT